MQDRAEWERKNAELEVQRANAETNRMQARGVIASQEAVQKNRAAELLQKQEEERMQREAFDVAKQRAGLWDAGEALDPGGEGPTREQAAMESFAGAGGSPAQIGRVGEMYARAREPRTLAGPNGSTIVDFGNGQMQLMRAQEEEPTAIYATGADAMAAAKAAGFNEKQVSVGPRGSGFSYRVGTGATDRLGAALEALKAGKSGGAAPTPTPTPTPAKPGASAPTQSTTRGDYSKYPEIEKMIRETDDMSWRNKFMTALESNDSTMKKQAKRMQEVNVAAQKAGAPLPYSEREILMIRDTFDGASASTFEF
jgi:hypothetical protein